MMRSYTSLILTIIALLLCGNLYFQIFPVSSPVYSSISPEQKSLNKQNNKIIKEVSKVINEDLSIKGAPTVATITDADALRKNNEIQAEVYKDAKNGDIAIGFTEEMIIYRKDEKKIVYRGKNPVRILQEKNYFAEIQIITNKVKAKTNLPANETPSLSIVTTPDTLKVNDPIKYKNIALGDRILVFKDRMIIYRLTDDIIIYDGPITNSNANQQQVPAPTTEQNQQQNQAQQ